VSLKKEIFIFDELKYVSLENRKMGLKKDTSAAISEYAKGEDS
jgi:hypothetical protein